MQYNLNGFFKEQIVFYKNYEKRRHKFRQNLPPVNEIFSDFDTHAAV
jgi:hypothetical protein